MACGSACTCGFATGAGASEAAGAETSAANTSARPSSSRAGVGCPSGRTDGSSGRAASTGRAPGPGTSLPGAPDRAAGAPTGSAPAGRAGATGPAATWARGGGRARAGVLHADHVTLILLVSFMLGRKGSRAFGDAAGGPDIGGIGRGNRLRRGGGGRRRNRGAGQESLGLGARDAGGIRNSERLRGTRSGILDRLAQLGRAQPHEPGRQQHHGEARGHGDPDRELVRDRAAQTAAEVAAELAIERADEHRKREGREEDAEQVAGERAVGALEPQARAEQRDAQRGEHAGRGAEELDEAHVQRGRAARLRPGALGRRHHDGDGAEGADHEAEDAQGIAPEVASALGVTHCRSPDRSGPCRTALPTAPR